MLARDSLTATSVTATASRPDKVAVRRFGGFPLLALLSVMLTLLGACAPAAVQAQATLADATSPRQQTGPQPSTLAAAAARPAIVNQSGLASWYGPGFAGRLTANGEIFDPSQLTAAHKELPFNTLVRVHNLENGRTVVVRINDRGPFKPGRVIDLSRAGAESLKSRVGCRTTSAGLPSAELPLTWSDGLDDALFVAVPSLPRPPRLRRRLPPRLGRPSRSGRGVPSGLAVPGAAWVAPATCSAGLPGC